MKRFWTIAIPCIVMLCMGCAGPNKMRMPLAEIDRPIVDPKGTWSIKPGVSTAIAIIDTVTYRSFTIGDYDGLFFYPSYSLTDNLSLPYIPFPYLVWQLTKSPLVDTTARYKWQFALGAGTTGIWPDFARGKIEFLWKKRLSPAVWYEGGINSFFAYIYYGKKMITQPPGISNMIGFQLSPKASVESSIGLVYVGGYNWLAGSGAFNFHYCFSQWFSLNVGSGMGFAPSRKATSIDLNIGSEFYW
jgi:hypothetical protein